MNPPYTVAVVAMTPNRVIGRGGQLPWHLPGDLRFFRRITMDQAVLMGRKTWESIGRPLPGRRNIILSRTLEEAPQGVELIRAPEEIDELQISTKLCVIGGAEIYGLFLPKCDEVILSLVRQEYDGDTFFPEFETHFHLEEIVESQETFEARRYTRKRSS